MVWVVIICGLIVLYWWCSIRKEDKPGHERAQQFTVDAMHAIMMHKQFGHLTGIQSAIDGKSFEDWTESDTKKWYEHYGDIASKRTYVTLTYLPSANAYYVFTDNSGKYPSVV